MYHQKSQIIHDCLNIPKVLTNLILKYLQQYRYDDHPQTLTGHDEWVMSVTELQNSQLASCSYDNTIKIWDLQSGKCHQTLNQHQDLSYALLQLPSGLLAVG